MDYDTFCEGAELVERVAGDIAHTSPVTGPVLRAVFKRISKKDIIQNTTAGKDALSKVTERLSDPNYEPVLRQHNLLVGFITQYAERHEDLEKLEKNVKDIKFYQIWLKHSLYKTSVQYMDGATGFQSEVYKKSAWVRLGLKQLPDDRLVFMTDDEFPSDQPEIHSSLSPLPSSSTTSSTSGHPKSSHELEVCTLVDSSEYHSDTDSVWGNPWKTDVLDPTCGGDSDSEGDTVNTALDKGKARAE